MIPAQVQVNVDEQAIKEYIQQRLDKTIHETLLLVDVEKLAAMTSMSKRFLEDEILCDPRMRIIERRKARKRWWPHREAVKVILEITGEW